MRFGGSRRNDTNHLVILLFEPRMNDQYDRAWANRSQSYPVFFFFISVVALGESVWIVKNQDRRLKPNVVLPKILLVLRPIPFEAHRGI